MAQAKAVVVVAMEDKLVMILHISRDDFKKALRLTSLA